MKQSNREIFNKYSNSYEKVTQKKLNFFNKSREYFDSYKVKTIKENLGNNIESILDYGSGIGLATKFFLDFFPAARIYAYDISDESIKILKESYPNINTNQKEIFNRKFDLITCFGVFHHINKEERLKYLKLISNMLKDTGKLFIFEHNPYNPVTRHIVSNCPYDENVELISMKEFISYAKKEKLLVCNKGYTLFFPERLKYFRKFEKKIRWLPLGGQYYLEFKKVKN
jgi:2-polyprenyl-3-methyl-5-hydroxy-6-metoxy-1,4-benzoquinol methylase